MQYSQSGRFEQTIVLEIRSDSGIFPTRSITFLEDGIRLVLPVPQSIGESVQDQSQHSNIKEQNQMIYNSKETQTKFTLSLKSLIKESSYTQIIQPAQANSIGTQTTTFANPKVLVNNNKTPNSSNIAEESQLLMNVWKASKSLEMQNTQSIIRSRQDSKQENEYSVDAKQSQFEQSPILKQESPFAYKRIFDLQQDQLKSKQRSSQFIYNGNGTQTNLDSLTQNKNQIEEFKSNKPEKKIKQIIFQQTNSNARAQTIQKDSLSKQKLDDESENSSSMSKILEACSFTSSQLNGLQDQADYELNSQHSEDESMSSNEQEEIKQNNYDKSSLDSEILYINEATFLPQPYSLTQKPNYQDFKHHSQNKEFTKQQTKIQKSSKKICKQKIVKAKEIISKSKKKIQLQEDSEEFKQDDRIKKSLGGRNSKYQCKFCKKRFKQCAALGGHISKAHPGQSSAYNHKKTVREQRELERMLHKDAMQYYFKKYNGRGKDSRTLNRNTIKRIKKMLVYEKSDYKVLRTKFLGKYHQIPTPEGEKSNEENEGIENQSYYSQNKEIDEQQLQENDSKEKIIKGGMKEVKKDNSSI